MAGLTQEQNDIIDAQRDNIAKCTGPVRYSTYDIQRAEAPEATSFFVLQAGANNS